MNHAEPPPSGPSHLFAYGTLKPTSARQREAGGWILDAVRGRLFDLGAYPALVDLADNDAPWIEGYVRPVQPMELIEILDPYEAVDEGLFQRHATQTRAGRLVWVYVYGRTLPADARGPLLQWQPTDPQFTPNLLGRPYSAKRST